MANAQLELAKREHSSRLAAANRRNKMNNFENTLVRKGAVIGTAAVFGTMNRMDVPVAIYGLPWKLFINAGALLVEGLSSGKLQAAAGGISDATTAIFTERAISENTLIVGQGPTDDGGELE